MRWLLVTLLVALLVPESPSVSVRSCSRLRDVWAGSSSSAMIPAPLLSSIVALTAPSSSTANVSSASTDASPVTLTVIVLVVSPGANVTVPTAALKSDPAVAGAGALPPVDLELSLRHDGTGRAVAFQAHTPTGHRLVDAL